MNEVNAGLLSMQFRRGGESLQSFALVIAPFSMLCSVLLHNPVLPASYHHNHHSRQESRE